MEQQEQILMNAVLTTFNGNLQFLNQYDNKLFQRVAALNSAIESGVYKEQYFLEFIKEDGEFDIFQESTQKYLYDRKPTNWNNKAIKNQNFDSNGIFNTLVAEQYIDKQVDLSDIDVNNIFDRSELQLYSDISSYNSILKLNVNNRYNYKKFNKFAFIGTLLGRHIFKIAEKLKTKNHFVYESNLEIFRLSLFVCDYSILARDGRSVIFSIMDDEEELENKIKIFTKVNSALNNGIIKYFTTNIDAQICFQKFLDVSKMDSPFGYHYRVLLEANIKGILQKVGKYKFLSTINNKKFNQFDFLFSKPIIILGAGPSLKYEINWLKENRDRFIIVAIGATLKTLSANNIVPDIITTADPQERTILNQFTNVKGNIEVYKDTLLFATDNTPNSVLELFENDNVYLFEISLHIRENSENIYGNSIGESTLSLMLSFNPKEIYLLGLDAAIDSKTGQTHIGEHSSSKVVKYSSSIHNIDNVSNYNKEHLSVKGNMEDKVVTTNIFHQLILNYNYLIPLYKAKDTTIYNLSKNGAYFKQTVPLKVEDIDISKYDIIDNSIKNFMIKTFFNQNSLLEITNSEKEFYKNEMEFLNSILVDVENIKNKKIKHLEQFEQLVDIIDKKIIDYRFRKKLLFLFTYDNFQSIIYKYITYCLNISDNVIPNRSKAISNLSYIWCEHFEFITNKFIKFLENLIKKG